MFSLLTLTSKLQTEVTNHSHHPLSCSNTLSFRCERRKRNETIREKAEHELNDLQNDILPGERKQPPPLTADESRSIGASKFAQHLAAPTTIRPVGFAGGQAQPTQCIVRGKSTNRLAVCEMGTAMVAKELELELSLIHI